MIQENIQLSNVVCLPNDRGMDARFQNVTIVNIYAPSGYKRRRGWENLFSNELPSLLRDMPPSFLVGGDFNSVLTNLDATRHPNYSRALQEFIIVFELPGMRETSQEYANNTQYTSRVASRIDRKCASRNLSRQERGPETRVAAFTDHLAVVIRIALEATTMRRGRSF